MSQRQRPGGQVALRFVLLALGCVLSSQIFRKHTRPQPATSVNNFVFLPLRADQSSWRLRASAPHTSQVARAAASSDDGVASGSSVRYLPPLEFGGEELTVGEDAFVLPCFPLGGVYIPDTTSQVLNIFEPRYRSMYNDILLSGGRRFIVPQTEQDEVGGVRLAEVGVVFYLDDLKEVSELTNDQVKFVCSHSVIGRVRLKRVLNPTVFADRSTYLRVEVEDLVDKDEGVDATESEQQVYEMLMEVATLQKKTDAPAPFRDFELQGMNMTRSGLWNAVKIWDRYLMRRVEQRQAQFKQDLMARVQLFANETSAELAGPVAFDAFPADVQKDLAALQDQFKEEVVPIMTTKGERVQEMIQIDSHAERLAMFGKMVEDEKKRLEARLAIKAIFDN